MYYCMLLFYFLVSVYYLSVGDCRGKVSCGYFLVSVYYLSFGDCRGKVSCGWWSTTLDGWHTSSWMWRRSQGHPWPTQFLVSTGWRWARPFSGSTSIHSSILGKSLKPKKNLTVRTCPCLLCLHPRVVPSPLLPLSPESPLLPLSPESPLLPLPRAVPQPVLPALLATPTSSSFLMRSWWRQVREQNGRWLLEAQELVSVVFHFYLNLVAFNL